MMHAREIEYWSIYVVMQIYTYLFIYSLAVRIDFNLAHSLDLLSARPLESSCATGTGDPRVQSILFPQCTMARA